MTSAKGEMLREYVQQLGIEACVIAASTPETPSGGFYVLKGEQELVISLLVTMFREQPELFMQIVGTIFELSLLLSDEDLAAKAKERQGKSQAVMASAKF